MEKYLKNKNKNSNFNQSIIGPEINYSLQNNILDHDNLVNNDIYNNCVESLAYNHIENDYVNGKIVCNCDPLLIQENLLNFEFFRYKFY